MTPTEYSSANARDSDVRELTLSAFSASEEAKGLFNVSDDYNLDYFTFRFSSHVSIYHFLSPSL